jgi:hypothetical protein
LSVACDMSVVCSTNKTNPHDINCNIVESDVKHYKPTNQIRSEIPTCYVTLLIKTSLINILRCWLSKETFIVTLLIIWLINTEITFVISQLRFFFSLSLDSFVSLKTIENFCLAECKSFVSLLLLWQSVKVWSHYFCCGRV